MKVRQISLLIVGRIGAFILSAMMIVGSVFSMKPVEHTQTESASFADKPKVVVLEQETFANYSATCTSTDDKTIQEIQQGINVQQASKLTNIEAQTVQIQAGKVVIEMKPDAEDVKISEKEQSKETKEKTFAEFVIFAGFCVGLCLLCFILDVFF